MRLSCIALGGAAFQDLFVGKADESLGHREARAGKGQLQALHPLQLLDLGSLALAFVFLSKEETLERGSLRSCVKIQLVKGAVKAQGG